MTAINENAVTSGEEVLLAYLYPLSKADMTAAQRDEFAKAADEQAAYMASSDGQKDRTIRSESVGDVRVTYTVPDGAMSAGAVAIAPAARNRLLRCGLMTRWF